jgi:hypothetical protein
MAFPFPVGAPFTGARFSTRTLTWLNVRDFVSNRVPCVLGRPQGTPLHGDIGTELS